MPRTAAVLAMSLNDLERAMRERRRALNKLERQRVRWRKKLDAVERKIAGVTGSVGGRRGGLGSRSRNEVSLPEAIERVLARAGGPMNVGAIAGKVLASGYHSGSANFRNIVNQMLIKERKRFKNVGRGMYELGGSGGPGGPRRRKRKRPPKK